MAPIRKKHDPVIVRQALEDVRLGVLSLNRASKVYNIPYATLGDKLRGRRPIAASNRNFLTDDEEKSLSAWLIGRAKLGLERQGTTLKTWLSGYWMHAMQRRVPRITG